MPRRSTGQLFEQLRREYEFGVGTIKGVAAKFGVHRRMVRQAIKSAVPPEYKRPLRQRPKLDAVRAFIDRILEEDKRAPRKQRHTAHRIDERIKQEVPGAQISPSTVRRYVRIRKAELGLLAGATFVPQHYEWGVEAQVDWYEAIVDVGERRQAIQIFVMRSMASGAAFHRAYPRATQQAFLEAHEHAFRYFGGVFRLLRYDNLKSAVRKILRGHKREECERFVAFRSHWQYAAEFCNPAQGHEKGGVESEVGRFRRNYLVPVPCCANLSTLNAYLLAQCQRDEARQAGARELTVGAGMLCERARLLPLAHEGFALAEESFCSVDTKGCVRAVTNWYSVPLRPGIRCRVRVLPTVVEAWHEGVRVAHHERCYGRRQQLLDLEHYLDVLERKPGAFAGSKPLAQWRAEGRWTAVYDELWEALKQRHGTSEGTRLMIEVVQMGGRSGYVQLTAAITQALSLGTHDAAAVRYLLSASQLSEAPAPPLPLAESPVMQHDYYARPLPQLTAYDQLLGGASFQPAGEEVAR